MIGLFGTSVIALLALAFGAFMSILYYRQGQKNVNLGKGVAGLKSTLKVHQRTNNRTVATANRLAEDLRRVQTRVKYFVDLLNVLANEPFSRRKREAFFQDVRMCGIDGALIGYEQKYGNLLEKDYQMYKKGEAFPNLQQRDELRAGIVNQNFNGPINTLQPKQ